jgi:hypothetical protein
MCLLSVLGTGFRRSYRVSLISLSNQVLGSECLKRGRQARNNNNSFSFAGHSRTVGLLRRITATRRKPTPSAENGIRNKKRAFSLESISDVLSLC